MHVLKESFQSLQSRAAIAGDEHAHRSKREGGQQKAGSLRFGSGVACLLPLQEQMDSERSGQ